MKRCPKCKTEKMASQFSKSSGRYDGLQEICKECHSEYRRQYYQRNKEKERELSNKWRSDNIDRSREITRRAAERRRRERPEAVATNRRRYYEKHASEIIGRVRERRLGVERIHTEGEWEDLCLKCGNKCLRCGREGPLTRDHVIPISRGGSDHISNIQPLCQRCNDSKGAKEDDYR